MTNHHTRKGYEQLYSRLWAEGGNTIIPCVKSMSDYELLGQINIELVNHNCIPFTYSEIKKIKSIIKQNP